MRYDAVLIGYFSASEMQVNVFSYMNIIFGRGHAASFNIYKDTGVLDTTSHHQPDMLKMDVHSWHALGSRAERNKENNAMPTKWKAYKVSSNLLMRNLFQHDLNPCIVSQKGI